MGQEIRELVAQLRERLAVVREGGSESARRKHTDRGKLLARDRFDVLRDPGSPFLELSPLAAYGMYGDDGEDFAVPSASIVTGIGRVSGPECVIGAKDATVKGRHAPPDPGQEVSARAGVALATKLPCVLRWRVLAEAGRGVPGQGAPRPDLLQPGQPVGRGHPADRGVDGLVHRGLR